MNLREVVLLGGSGDVGARLVPLLLKDPRVAVTVVSRHAEGISDPLEGRVRHTALDLSNAESLGAMAEAVVVNLTEATSPSLVGQVIGAGGWFLETSATPGYLRAVVEALDGADGTGNAILCVGMAPGMTNLLAEQVTAKAAESAQIDIGVEMGMGRHYGAAATEWFLRTAGQSYPLVIDGSIQTVLPGQMKRKFAFSTGGPLRRSIGYGFAEQTMIAERSEHRLKTVRSFVALDPAWMTRSLAFALSLGLGPAIGRNARRLTKWLRRLPAFGPARTRIVVEGFDDAGRLTGQIRLETGDQAEATAAIISATVESVFERREGHSPQVSTIADHLNLDKAVEALRRAIPDTRVDASGPTIAGQKTEIRTE